MFDFLLIPGFMLDRSIWDDLRPALTELGRVIDADTTHDTSIEAMADRAIAELSGPTIVIGFSMGGYVARAIAYRAPSLVCGLLLIATSSKGMTPSPKSINAASFQQLSRSAVMHSLHPDHRDPITIERIQIMSHNLGGNVFERQSQIIRKDDTSRLDEIHCPTAIIAAAQDELRSIKESEILHHGIAGSTLTIVEKCGHLVPIEHPETILTVIREIIPEISN